MCTHGSGGRQRYSLQKESRALPCDELDALLAQAELEGDEIDEEQTVAAEEELSDEEEEEKLTPTTARTPRKRRNLLTSYLNRKDDSYHLRI